MKRILLVEDDSAFLEVLRKVLVQAEYRVTVASDGLIALRLMENESFDLVMTDILMPNHDGVELVKHIKKNTPDMKIIAMSGGGSLGSETYLTTVKLLGADATLTKPFEMRELFSCMKDLLGE